MGNTLRRRRMSLSPSSSPSEEEEEAAPAPSNSPPFEFHGIFEDDLTNGLYFNNVYLPEEVVLLILSYIEPKRILKASLVCKKWCNLIKSDQLWAEIYSRRTGKKAKKLPWYVYYCYYTTNYFDTNLLRNGNGQEKLLHWKIFSNGGQGFRIEDPPTGADPLPLDVPEFNGKTSCFATSFAECNKFQMVSFKNSNLMQLIFDKFKPHIYLSEWVAGRFDCGCVYTLWCKLIGDNEKDEEKRATSISLRYRFPPIPPLDQVNSSRSDSIGGYAKALKVEQIGKKIEQWEGSGWSKVELVVKDYPSGVKRVIFQHMGKDTQFWAGYYGSKMAGGVVKILFDSMEPLNVAVQESVDVKT